MKKKELKKRIEKLEKDNSDLRDDIYALVEVKDITETMNVFMKYRVLMDIEKQLF